MQRIDAVYHVRGESEFVDDMPPPAEMLYAAVFASPVVYESVPIARIEDMPLISWLQSLPSLGRDFVDFFLIPREFTINWIANSQTRLSSWDVLAWSLTIIAVLYAVYAVIFRSIPFNRLFPNPYTEESELATRNAKPKPRIIGFGIKRVEVQQSMEGKVRRYTQEWGYGFGTEFPEATQKGFNEPQLLIFRIGITDMIVADVIPAKFSTKSAQTFFVIIFSLIATISSFPFAWLLGTKLTFGDVVDFTVSVFSYCLLFWALLTLLAVLIIIDVLKIDIGQRFQNIRSGFEFAVWYIFILLWNAIAFLPVFRSVYLSYKQLYYFVHWQMVLVGLAGAFLSVFIAPIIFVPMFYLWLKINDVVEAII